MPERLTDVAETVLERRYYLKDNNGNITETWGDVCSRIATHISQAIYDEDERKRLECVYYQGLYDLDFMPNSPTIMNAGTKMGQLAGCFVLDIEDSMDGIFQTLKNTALIFQSGGGVGTDFSPIRHKGAIVNSSGSEASGALSFISVFNSATGVIAQAGKRRGASMGILDVRHKEIKDFIKAKEDPNAFNNFNFSVAITDDFMESIEAGDEEALEIFDLIATKAHATAEPGVLFKTTANKCNPIPHCGELTATNACSEQWLLPNESCVLTSINLDNFVSNDGVIDWDRLEDTVKVCVNFLNGLIDVNKYPLQKIEEATKYNRKIGLGIMAVADVLVKLELPYSSQEGRDAIAGIMQFIYDKAKNESERLASIHGAFPSYDPQYCTFPPRRNAALCSCQPTGTCSMIAGCSSGVEPYFSIVSIKTVMDGTRLIMTVPAFERVAKREGFYSDELMQKISDTGTVIGHTEIPKKWQEVFRTAQDITPENHILMVAAIQNNGVDSSISKTINMPATSTVDDVKKAYMLAWKTGCKGASIYVDGCRAGQVLTSGSSMKEKQSGTVNTSGPIKQDLPDILNAKRYKLKLDDNENLYVIICCDDDNKPMEVFVKFPYSGRHEYREKSTMYTTTCRLISLGLRYGIPVEEIIKQLDKSSGSMVDLPAQLTKLLKMFLSETDKPYSVPCPDCGDGLLVFEEGCSCCKSCGYSKCS